MTAVQTLVSLALDALERGEIEEAKRILRVLALYLA